MTFETRSLVGTDTRHSTFKSALDLYEQSRTGKDEESLSFGNVAARYNEKTYPLGLIWRISFNDGIRARRWVHATASDLLDPNHDGTHQRAYLDQHEDEVKQRGVLALMEEISQRRIQSLCELSETFAGALDSQEMDLDQVFWLDQPLEDAEYRLVNGFVKIIEVLTEDEFKARYYS